LDEEEIYEALQEHLKRKHGIEIKDAATLLFPSTADADSNQKYIVIEY
jgi:hypothetical protein